MVKSCGSCIDQAAFPSFFVSCKPSTNCSPSRTRATSSGELMHLHFKLKIRGLLSWVHLRFAKRYELLKSRRKIISGTPIRPLSHSNLRVCHRSRGTTCPRSPVRCSDGPVNSTFSRFCIHRAESPIVAASGCPSTSFSPAPSAAVSRFRASKILRLGLDAPINPTILPHHQLSGGCPGRC